ncbi:uncharacterized protein LOC126897400 [Daktulosphaira vitifoliae]|uniref:uncharacterized protein LOC126897400 n=1 Tax=Daktulosphaira vitifoliae TaxID=58002 RepID=UPI0021A996EF|nr:uncharacterized protein LOC126897400 [Daktulosphaira vitifoliae]
MKTVGKWRRRDISYRCASTRRRHQLNRRRQRRRGNKTVFSQDHRSALQKINKRTAPPTDKMFRASAIVLWAFLVTLSKGDDVECPVCLGSVPQCCTIRDCEHGVCIVCTTKILSSSNKACPICRRPINGVKGTDAYEADLADFKRAVLDGSVTREQTIARYHLLLPWHAPDQQLLNDVRRIGGSYSAKRKLLDGVRADPDGYGFAEDVAARRKYTEALLDNAERTALLPYYQRTGLDPRRECVLRSTVYKGD